MMYIWILLMIFIVGLSYYIGSVFVMGTDNSNIAKKLLRQSARWALAAKQDKSVLVSLLHSNYAAAYLWVLKDVVPNMDVKQFEEKITSLQDKVTKRVADLCPNFVIDTDKYFAAVAGEL